MKEALYKITEQCPCNCLFCKSEDFGIEKISHQELDFADWKRITDKLIKIGLQVVVISGGEPLIYLNTTLDLINYLKSKNIFTVLNTSGVIFNNLNYLDKLKLNFPNLLVFSIDSSSQNQHDENRKVFGLFRTIIETIKKLKTSDGYPLAIRVVITNKNYKQIPDIIQIFNELRIDCIKFTNIENDTKGLYCLSYSDLLVFNEQIRNRIIQSLRNCYFATSTLQEDGISKFSNLFNAKKVDYDLFSKGIFSPSFTKDKACSLIERYCVVQSNGDILPCCESEHYNFPIYGNIKRDKIESIFTSKNFLKMKTTRAKYCINCTQPHNIQINFTDKGLAVNKR